MPAASEPPPRPGGPEQPQQPQQPELPALPVRFRPFGVRWATIVFGGLLVLTVAVIWFAFPPDVRAQFTPFQKLTVLGMGAMAFVVCHALARCRVDVDDDGVTVVNGYRTHRFAWGQVVGVSLRPGDPWAVLDISDGTTRSAMGIQGSDGLRARRQSRTLRALLEAHAGSEPTRRRREGPGDRPQAAG
jgi:hypothetical protein